MKRITIGISIALLAGIVGFLLVPGSIERLDIISSNPNALIRHFAPTWRSMKRISDIPYTFLYAFRSTKLPIYEITLTKKDKERLLNNLPDYPRIQAMWEEYKKTVKVEFRTDDYYTADAKIRNRGVSPPHWNAVKKSWQISLPDEYPLKERTTLRLFLPEERGWIFGSMNSIRAKELGIISPEFSYVRLHINKTDMGIYILVEGWDEAMLEKKGRGIGPLFSNLNLDIRNVDLFRPDSINMWENRLEQQTPSASQDILAYFLDLTANAPDDVFQEALPGIMDMDLFYRWLIITSLSGNFHQGNGANQNWYFNPATEKLEPILFDAALTIIENPLSLENNRLANRVMQIPEFNASFTNLLREYLDDSSHKEKALLFYDETFQKIRRDILTDIKKIQTSSAVLDRIAVERDIVSYNYDLLSNMITENDGIHFLYADESYPLTNAFNTQAYAENFLAWNTSLSEFLAKNPQFEKRTNNIIAIKSGTHIFRRTIIVPKGFILSIDPGARLLFAPGVSLFSYSTVESRGTVSHPIIIQALDPQKPWGVFAIIGTSETNTFTYTHIADGNDATLNGMYFSGSLSVRSSDLIFTNGSITNSRADDGIHVLSGVATITNSLFKDTSSDGIDIDYAKGINSLIANSTFENAGGDAIDLSFSELTLSDNVIHGCGDKGISVGEASKPIIERHIITSCIFGIAIKDRSHAVIEDTELRDNQTGIGLYRKKPHFISGGTAVVFTSTFENNETNISIDEYSDITITDVKRPEIE